MWNDDTLTGGASLNNDNQSQDLDNGISQEDFLAERNNFATEETVQESDVTVEPNYFENTIPQADSEAASETDSETVSEIDAEADSEISDDTAASESGADEAPYEPETNFTDPDYESAPVYASYHISESRQPEPDRAAANQYEKNTSHNNMPKQKKKMGFIPKAIIAGLIFGIVAFGTMYVGSLIMPFKSHSTVTEKTNTTTQTTSPITTNSSDLTSDYQIAQVVQEVMPAVVSINCTQTTVYNSFFGQQEYQSTSAGTGIIVGSNDNELLIATNNHVVANSESMQIMFADGLTANAALKGSSSDVDLAVVAVSWDELSEETKAAIKIATLGDSSSLIVGEPSIAIGNALGYGQSVTYGIISALNREVTVTTDDSYGYGNSQEITSELIQTDAAINPGNSGGPLLNSKGEVIGINSVKYSSEEVEGMGYAIPISEALPILEELMNRETKVKVDEDKQSYLGITGSDVTSDAAMIYGMPSGVFVAQVIEDGPAANGGIKRGDIITELDGTSISSFDELKEELLFHEAGSTVEIIVNRNNGGEYEEIILEITLGSKSDAPTEEEINESSGFGY